MHNTSTATSFRGAGVEKTWFREFSGDGFTGQTALAAHSR